MESTQRSSFFVRPRILTRADFYVVCGLQTHTITQFDTELSYVDHEYAPQAIMRAEASLSEIPLDGCHSFALHYLSRPISANAYDRGSFVDILSRFQGRRIFFFRESSSGFSLLPTSRGLVQCANNLAENKRLIYF